MPPASAPGHLLTSQGAGAGASTAGPFGKQKTPLLNGSKPHAARGEQHAAPIAGVGQSESLQVRSAAGPIQAKPSPDGSEPHSAFGVQHAMPLSGFGHLESSQTPGTDDVTPPSAVPPSALDLGLREVPSSHAEAAARASKKVGARNRFNVSLLIQNHSEGFPPE